MKLLNKYIKKILSFNEFFFGAIVVVNVGILAIDTVSYNGFVSKNILIPSQFFLVLLSVSSLIVISKYFIFKKYLSEENELILRLNSIFFPTFLLIYTLLDLLETNNYPNYVFSKFHIHLYPLQKALYISVFLLILQILKKINIKFKSSKFIPEFTKQNTGILIFLLSLVLILSSRVVTILGIMPRETIFNLKYTFKTTESKNEYKFGEIYQIFKFIIRNTEENSTIAVPPQFKWGTIGNINFARYFLFPRRLVHPEFFIDKDIENIDYYIIGKSYNEIDGTKRFWPQEKIDADSIIIFDDRLAEDNKVVEPVFDPNNSIYKEKWGVIKLRN